MATAEDGAVNARQWTRRASKDVTQIRRRFRRRGRGPSAAHRDTFDRFGRRGARRRLIERALSRSVFHALGAAVLV